MRRATQLLLLAASAASIHCSDGNFVCATDGQCMAEGEAGMCQPNGYCSFPDPTCESGQRYGDHAPSTLAQTCVLAASDATGGDGGGSGGGTDGPGMTSTTGNGDAITTMTPDGDTTDGVDSSDGGPVEGGSSTGAASDTTTGPGEDSSTGPTLPCPPFFDDFDDGMIDPAWNQAFPEHLEEVGGELLISLTPADTTDAAGVQFFELDLTQAEATIELGVLPQSQFAQTTFAAIGPNNERHLAVVRPTGLDFRRADAGQPNEEIFTTKFDPIAHRWLRLRIDAPTLEFSTSPDGMDWTTQVETSFDWSYEDSRFEVLGTNWGELDEAEVVSIRSFEICPQ